MTLTSAAHIAFNRRVTSGEITYEITAEGDEGRPIELAIAGRDADDKVVTSLTGEIRLPDLAAVTELVSATLTSLMAVHSPVAPAAARLRAGNHGVRWTPEDDERLVNRHREGAKERELMIEFDRSRGGIRSRLEYLGEIQPRT
jgi:hypothetical protein